MSYSRKDFLMNYERFKTHKMKISSSSGVVRELRDILMGSIIWLRHVGIMNYIALISSKIRKSKIEGDITNAPPPSTKKYKFKV